ncbi:hypothetical protein TOPH_03577, partial [Tolypocladium ophioglossoides CBS 100239]
RPGRGVPSGAIVILCDRPTSSTNFVRQSDSVQMPQPLLFIAGKCHCCSAIAWAEAFWLVPSKVFVLIFPISIRHIRSLQAPLPAFVTNLRTTPELDHLSLDYATYIEAWLWDVVVGLVPKALSSGLHPNSGRRRLTACLEGADRTNRPISAPCRRTSYERHRIDSARQSRLIIQPDHQSDPTYPLTAPPRRDRQVVLGYRSDEIDSVRDVYETIRLSCLQLSACIRSVLAASETCRILRFAGHGGTRADPLHIDISNRREPSRFLAYLSACGTGRVQDKWSVNEGIHITSAFQLAGLRYVINTLCEVDDELCVEMAKLVYEYLDTNGLGDEAMARLAIGDRGTSRSAMAGLRDTTLCGDVEQDRPLWVPYIHFGV